MFDFIMSPQINFIMGGFVAACFVFNIIENRYFLALLCAFAAILNFWVGMKVM